MSSRQVPKRAPVKRPFSWWPYAIFGGVLIAIAAFLLATHNGGRSSSGSASAGERGLKVGTSAPSDTLQATSGNPISLSQMKGSKVVVYFYEGSG